MTTSMRQYIYYYHQSTLKSICCRVFKGSNFIQNHPVKIFLYDREHRDQGLTRPKVLIVLPFRESALRVVKMMMSLLMAKQEVCKELFVHNSQFL